MFQLCSMFQLVLTRIEKKLITFEKLLLLSLGDYKWTNWQNLHHMQISSHRVEIPFHQVYGSIIHFVENSLRLFFCICSDLSIRTLWVVHIATQRNGAYLFVWTIHNFNQPVSQFELFIYVFWHCCFCIGGNFCFPLKFSAQLTNWLLHHMNCLLEYSPIARSWTNRKSLSSLFLKTESFRFK